MHKIGFKGKGEIKLRHMYLKNSKIKLNKMKQKDRNA